VTQHRRAAAWEPGALTARVGFGSVGVLLQIVLGQEGCVCLTRVRVREYL